MAKRTKKQQLKHNDDLAEVFEPLQNSSSSTAGSRPLTYERLLTYGQQDKFEKALSATSSDVVNHPTHYIAGRKFEPIDVIEDWQLDHHLATALKYISRAGRKDDFNTDIEKAIWYLSRRLQLSPRGEK